MAKVNEQAMSDLEEILRGLARQVHGCVTDTECERVLRESGLLRLLEAGQAMRLELDDFGEPYAAQCQADWDAAKAAMKG